jgi:Ner family transcriptional regulator
MHKGIPKAMQRRIDAMVSIKARLERAGFSLTTVDDKYGLARGCASKTLVEPNLAGERAISAVLKTHPHLLWRERYRANGQRKDPQPMENYERPPTLKERRKAGAANPLQAAA